MTAAGGEWNGGMSGCQDWIAPDQCSPMNWYCDGWCQEACHDDWSLTWEWDQEAADRGDWEAASVTVCQKCVVPKDAKKGKGSYFVWSSGENKRICAVGESVHKEPAPDALRNDWGYDWCEWPAQMDWNKPEEGCYKPSCPHTGFDPQWGQTAGGGEGGGSGMDYAQICLDQEPEEKLGCPPGMSVMSVWEEGDEMNQWGYYNWEENFYCVKTREMKSLKTPRDDLHKVFHYYDWIVEEEEQGEEPIDDFPEEALTEDFDTTEGDWVEKEDYATVYEGDEEEFLATGAVGFEDSGMNEHDVEPMGEWEEEHHDVDPNLYMEDSGMFDEVSTDPEELATKEFWDEEEWGTELPAEEHYEEFEQGDATTFATTGYENEPEEFKDETFATSSTAAMPKRRHRRKRRKHKHHRRRYSPDGAFYGSGAADFPKYDSGFGGDYGTYDYGYGDSGMGDYGYATTGYSDNYDSGFGGDYGPAHFAGHYDSGMGDYGYGDYGTYDYGYGDSGMGDYGHYDSGFGGHYPTNDFGDYGGYSDNYDSGFGGDYGYDSGMDTHFAGHFDSGMDEPAHFAGYGSGMPKRKSHKKRKTRKNRHH